MSYRLTPEDVRFFHDEGYLGPYTMHSPEEMDQIRPVVEHEIFEAEGPFHVNRQKSRHLDNRTIYDLCYTSDHYGSDRRHSWTGYRALAIQFFLINPPVPKKFPGIRI